MHRGTNKGCNVQKGYCTVIKFIYSNGPSTYSVRE